MSITIGLWRNLVSPKSHRHPNRELCFWQTLQGTTGSAMGWDIQESEGAPGKWREQQLGIRQDRARWPGTQRAGLCKSLPCPSRACERAGGPARPGSFLRWTFPLLGTTYTLRVRAGGHFLPPPVDVPQSNHYFCFYCQGYLLFVECRQLLRDFVDGWAQIL